MSEIISGFDALLGLDSDIAQVESQHHNQFDSVNQMYDQAAENLPAVDVQSSVDQTKLASALAAIDDDDNSGNEGSTHKDELQTSRDDQQSESANDSAEKPLQPVAPVHRNLAGTRLNIATAKQYSQQPDQTQSSVARRNLAELLNHEASQAFMPSQAQNKTQKIGHGINARRVHLAAPAIDRSAGTQNLQHGVDALDKTNDLTRDAVDQTVTNELNQMHDQPVDTSDDITKQTDEQPAEASPANESNEPDTKLGADSSDNNKSELSSTDNTESDTGTDSTDDAAVDDNTAVDDSANESDDAAAVNDSANKSNANTDTDDADTDDADTDDADTDTDADDNDDADTDTDADDNDNISGNTESSNAAKQLSIFVNDQQLRFEQLPLTMSGDVTLQYDVQNDRLLITRVDSRDNRQPEQTEHVQQTDYSETKSSDSKALRDSSTHQPLEQQLLDDLNNVRLAKKPDRQPLQRVHEIEQPDYHCTLRTSKMLTNESDQLALIREYANKRAADGEPSRLAKAIFESSKVAISVDRDKQPVTLSFGSLNLIKLSQAQTAIKLDFLQ